MRLMLAALLLAGCASNPGVAPYGENTFLVTRQAATAFSGNGGLKVDALREAETFCRERRQALQVVEVNESQGPYMLGKYPRVDVRFSCVARA